MKNTPNKDINSVKEKTLAHNLCINCGICKFVCPYGAISLKRNSYKELIPVVDEKKCKNCGMCTKYCPHTKEKMLKECENLQQVQFPEKRGLEDSYNYYLAWNPNDKERIKSASGGIITKLALSLLEDKKIDGVIHAQRLYAKYGEVHFAGALSKTAQEILDRASSIYAPICFDEILLQLEENKTYLFCGTPCIIRAVKNLFEKHPKFKNIKILTCALICSHIVNEQYSDWLADCNKISKNIEYKVNFRNKDGLDDINNFNTHFYSKDRDILKKNRNYTGFTESWRNYYFAMHSCLYCSDIWGYTADISVKDAWDKYSTDNLGRSLVVIRDNDLNNYFRTMQIKTEPVSAQDVLENELPSAIFKQKEAYNKMFLPLFSKINIKNGLLKRKITSKLSKVLYKYLGFKITKLILRRIDKKL